jgi:DNA-binding protein H-NS
MPSANIKALSVPQLLAMRADIDKQLQSRKVELQAQLAQIGDGIGGKARSVEGSKVAPKYKHPWSGRGGVAGWLAREIKSGKKRDDFLIAKAATKKRAKKSG